MSLMAWSSDFTKEIPTLSLPVGDQVVVLDPEDASIVHHVLGEFLRDCAVHRRAPGAIQNQTGRRRGTHTDKAEELLRDADTKLHAGSATTVSYGSWESTELILAACFNLLSAIRALESTEGKEDR